MLVRYVLKEAESLSSIGYICGMKESQIVSMWVTILLADIRLKRNINVREKHDFSK